MLKTSSLPHFSQGKMRARPSSIERPETSAGGAGRSAAGSAFLGDISLTAESGFSLGLRKVLSNRIRRRGAYFGGGGGGGGGDAEVANAAASCGTCPAGVQAAMPWLHTSDSRFNCPPETPCAICCRVNGP